MLFCNWIYNIRWLILRNTFLLFVLCEEILFSLQNFQSNARVSYVCPNLIVLNTFLFKMIFDNSMAIYSRQIFPTSNHKLQFQYTSFSKVNIGNVILGENIGNESQSYELFVASDFHFQMSNSERASLVVYDEFGSIVGTVQFSLLDVLHDEIDWFTGDVGPWSDYFSFDYSDLYLTAFDDSSGLRFFVIESASSSQNGENKIRYTRVKYQISVRSQIL